MSFYYDDHMTTAKEEKNQPGLTGLFYRMAHGLNDGVESVCNGVTGDGPPLMSGRPAYHAHSSDSAAGVPPGSVNVSTGSPARTARPPSKSQRARVNGASSRSSPRRRTRVSA